MKIKKLMPLDAESRRLIDWMEKGIGKWQSALLSMNFQLVSDAQWRFLGLLGYGIYKIYFSVWAISSGVYDALQKKYLKTLLFCICEDVEGPMIEEYSCESIHYLFLLWWDTLLVRTRSMPTAAVFVSINFR